MTNACLCYTCDKNYLLPTLISSSQARAHLSRQLADVIVFVIGDFDDPGGSVSRLFAAGGVMLKKIERSAIDNLPIQFARHCLDRLLEPEYERIMHIDSDTQIAESLDPLFRVILPPGALIAAPDPLAIRIDEDGRFWEKLRQYFKSIGVEDRNLSRYVNMGIFGASRHDLAMVGRECIRYCATYKELRYIEQDAVNLTCNDRVKLISMRWNFPVFFSNCGFETLVKPHVLHFMSNPRPWQGPFRPWGQPAYRIYVDAVASEPNLAPFAPRLSKKQSLKYWLQQHYKTMVEHHSWARAHIRERIMQLEGQALV